jgi:cellulase
MTVNPDGSLTWAVDKLVAANGVYSATIPASIPSGDYLLRSEIIALHSAGSPGGAQFYMGCAQISVNGGGSANPPTVKFPGAYKSSDPGVTINIYYPVPTNYVIPGPPVFTG